METFSCPFAKLGGCKELQTKAVLVTKSNWQAKTFNPWENHGNEEEEIVVIDREVDGMPHAVAPLTQQKTKAQHSNPKQRDSPQFRKH